VVCTGVVVVAVVAAAGVEVLAGVLATGVVARFAVVVVREWDVCGAADEGFACVTPVRCAAAEAPRWVAVELTRDVVGETVGVVSMPAGLENIDAEALLAGLDEPVYTTIRRITAASPAPSLSANRVSRRRIGRSLMT
jgi:hypothetical protein